MAIGGVFDARGGVFDVGKVGKAVAIPLFGTSVWFGTSVCLRSFGAASKMTHLESPSDPLRMVGHFNPNNGLLQIVSS